MKKTESLSPYLILVIALIFLAIPPETFFSLPSGKEPTTDKPPTPPLLETFQGSPQLSLFPRLGDYRPEDGEERLLFWRSYRDHLLRISGVVKENAILGNKVFSFRGIKSIDSVGHFAPLAVKPSTSYRLRLKLNATLPEKASTGVGILQFNKFLWLGEQYPESLQKEIFVGSNELLRIRKTNGWQEFDLQFTSGPETRMVHLVLFREGPASDRVPVMVDNISVEGD